MIPPVKQRKDLLRREYKAKRRSIPPEEKLRRDREICRYAQLLASFRYAEYVLLYDAMPDEISVTEIAYAALEKGKKIAYPRCNTENCTMTYHIVSSPEELVPDAYGIREPLPSAPVFPSEFPPGNALCFVPGLLFDRDGFRLGYGKGYYDRFLSSFPGSRIGVIYTDFIVPSVPRGRFDVKMDILLTEKNVRNIRVQNEN